MILGLVFYYLIMQWNSNILNVTYSRWLWWSQSNILLNNTNLMREGASWRHSPASVKPLFWPVSNEGGVWIRVFIRWTSPAVLTKFLLVGKIIPGLSLPRRPKHVMKRRVLCHPGKLLAFIGHRATKKSCHRKIDLCFFYKLQLQYNTKSRINIPIFCSNLTNVIFSAKINELCYGW